MEFDYFYGEQSELFAFYRTPKVFYTDERFRRLSSDAKVLYGILLDRVGISAKNQWYDEAGRVYVYMTVKSIEEAMGCAHQKACGLLAELESFGLVERKKQGLGKPARIYVKNFVQVWNSYLKKYENHTSGGMKISSQEVWKSEPNNTEMNNTELNNIDSNLQEEVKEAIEERNRWREYFRQRLEVELLYQDYARDRELLEEILELIVDTICTTKETIRICGEYKPTEVVKAAFLKLEETHIVYVLSCLKENTSEVRNVKQYLLAMLYNAPLTMNGYYQALVNHAENEIKRKMEEE